ncbi:Radical SAM [Alloactinosynnema sp. L-07]|uniref:radical SAM protein n=1 Tax=Alloactinosynnema sp. L-07 TaxID=1653480 RepID=UPI00065EF581|nr:radical SAM protein [Alloactinosynnema sp. L-07]CRK60840.1 Radical SAM [Alloactinosynnema sp. L-07]
MNPSFVWLEITGKCQLSCSHCYADSGPQGTDGAMTPDNWGSVIDQAVGLGTEMVQFIGGEPTLHRALPDLVGRALGRGLQVEVFSNLVHVPTSLWEVFTQPGVSLATSYYADSADQHESITKGRGSYGRTKANIIEALRRSIPLRVGVIDVLDGQRVEQAREELAALGVTGEVRVDHLRQVGRGIRKQQPSLSQLCGHCAQDKIAVSATGDVWPCVFSRWLPVGNVRHDALADILAGPTMVTTTATLREHFGGDSPDLAKPCDPQCGPNCSPACNPSCWPTGAGPCGPKGGCQPNYDK